MNDQLGQPQAQGDQQAPQPTLADALAATEQQTGIRATWNVWPQAKCDALKQGIPLSLLYTPLKQVEGLYRVQYPPVACPKCSAVLSPYCQVNFASKAYSCPFCGAVNQLPPTYARITPEQRPAELHPYYRTLEYDLTPGAAEHAPIFVFVVDTVTAPEQFAKVKESLQWAIDALPPNCRVGLITYGTTCMVHELKFEFCPRKVVFRGQKDIPASQLEQYLGLRNPAQKFVLPLSECHDTLSQIIEDLIIDPWFVQPKNRPFRCTGLAASVAASMVACISGTAAAVPGRSPSAAQSLAAGGRVLLLASGPCTFGPGQIIDTELTSVMRDWSDIDAKGESAKHVKEAAKFYN